MELLASEGMTMLLVTPEMPFATRVSDRIVMMEDGRMVANKTAAELAAEPDNSRIRQFIDHASGGGSASPAPALRQGKPGGGPTLVAQA
jgi:polar amino acid transport system permease protein